MTAAVHRWGPRALVAVVVAVVLAVVVPRLGGPDPLLLRSTFDEVGSLVPRAHVRVGDVPVGTVRSIELTDDHRAEVTLAVDPDAPVPGEVTAVLRQTAILGERYVDLVPAPGAGGRLEDGQVIEGYGEATLEELVRGGDQLLAGVAADALGNAIRVGAATFDGRGATLGEVLDDLAVYTATLEADRGELGRLLDASERLTGALAPEAETTAAALDDLAALVDVLRAEEEQFVGALDDLAGASEAGTRILREEREAVDGLLRRSRAMAGEILRIDGALENVLFWLPRHNLHVPGGVVSEFSQVAVDVTVCGLNDDPADPSNACVPDNPGRSNHPAPGYQPTACQLFHVACDGVYDYPDGVTPYRGDVEARRVTQAEIDAAIDFAARTVRDRGQVPRDPDDADPRRARPPEGAS